MRFRAKYAGSVLWIGENGEFSGRKLYFLFQGASPEKWMLEAGEYTMNRFAKLYGMEYAGMATNRNEAEKLGRSI